MPGSNEEAITRSHTFEAHAMISMQRVHAVTRSFPSLDLPRFHLGNTIVLRATKGTQTETINAYNRSARIINRFHWLRKDYRYCREQGS